MWIGRAGRSIVLRICKRATWLDERVEEDLDRGRGVRQLGWVDIAVVWALEERSSFWRCQ